MSLSSLSICTNTKLWESFRHFSYGTMPSAWPDGADPEMEATQKRIAIAESLYRHKWDFETARSKALKKYHNSAKDTLYDFNYKLDQDVVGTQNNLNLLLLAFFAMDGLLINCFKFYLSYSLLSLHSTCLKNNLFIFNIFSLSFL